MRGRGRAGPAHAEGAPGRGVWRHMEKWNPTDAERTRFKEWVAGMKEMNRIVDEEARRLTVDQRLEEIAVLTEFHDSPAGISANRAEVSAYEDKLVLQARDNWNRLRELDRRRRGIGRAEAE